MHGILRAAAVQLNSRDDLQSNLEVCRCFVAAAAAEGARLVVLPENFALMASDRKRHLYTERLDGPAGPIRTMLSDSAVRHGIYLVAGGWPVASGDNLRPLNAASVVAHNGEHLATYSKIHLFDVDAPDGHSYRESAGATAGATPICVTVEGFRVGISICYDIRFPELYRRLVDMGADVLCIPAAFTAVTGQAHWEILCRARAIESQCYVIAAGQTGDHGGGRRTHGHSLLVDPWGDVLADAKTTEGVIVGELSTERIQFVRRVLPSLRHRRL